MPFVIRGFALSFRSLMDIFFNEACSAMIELTMVMKDSKNLSALPLFTSRIATQFVLTRSLSKLFLLSFLSLDDIFHCLLDFCYLNFAVEETEHSDQRLLLFPDIQPSSILLEKILSIRILERDVTREGGLM